MDHKGLKKNLPPVSRIKPSSAHRCSPPPVLSSTPLSPQASTVHWPLQATHARTVTPNAALPLTSMTAPSGVVQTEEKGHFLSVLDISGRGTRRGSPQPSQHQLSRVESRGGLGRVLSKFPLASPSQPPEVKSQVDKYGNYIIKKEVNYNRSNSMSLLSNLSSEANLLATSLYS